MPVRILHVDDNVFECSCGLPTFASGYWTNMKFHRLITLLFLSFLAVALHAQVPMQAFADSVRAAHGVPELGYAVVSADSVLAWAVLGTQRAGMDYPARPDDRFHIGSNTKALTCALALHLAKSGKLDFDLRFFDLFPEMRKAARRAYHDLSLGDLLSFRGPLQKYSYFSELPRREDLPGDFAAQRQQLVAHFLRQKPAPVGEFGLSPSNVSYVMAGMLLERASGLSFHELVRQFNENQNLNFGFGFPFCQDTLQPWGHDGEGKLVPPGDFYKLEWLLAAGNTNLSVPDGARWLQFFLRGYQGRQPGWTSDDIALLLFGRPGFAYGWFHDVDAETGHRYAHNLGNPGAFVSKFVLVPEIDRGYLIFCNSFSPPTNAAVDTLLVALQARYGH